jgi:spore coat-associated protein N
VKKFLILALALVTVLGMVGGAFAYFQDTETSTGNTFTAGTLDLKVGDGNEDYGDGVSTTWMMSNMIPGVTGCGPYSVNLKNTGTLEGDHLEISFSHAIIDTPDVPSDTDPHSTPDKLAKWIEIVGMSYDTINFVSIYNAHPTACDANLNGIFDLDDLTKAPWAGDGGYLDNLKPVPPHVGQTNFTTQLKFNAGATNDIQGDTLTTTVTFTLNQVASQ